MNLLVNLVLVLFIAITNAQVLSLQINFPCPGVSSVIDSNPAPINYTIISGQSTIQGSQTTYNFVGQPTTVTFLLSCQTQFSCFGEPSGLLIPAELTVNIAYNTNGYNIGGAIKSYNTSLPFKVLSGGLSSEACDNQQPCQITSRNGALVVTTNNNPKQNPNTVFNADGSLPIAFSFTGSMEYYTVANAPIYYGMNSLMATFNPNFVQLAYVPVPGLVYYFNVMSYSDDGEIQFSCDGENQSVAVLTQYYHTFILTPSFYQWNVDTTGVLNFSSGAPNIQTQSSVTVSCYYGAKCTYKTPQGNTIYVNILTTP